MLFSSVFSPLDQAARHESHAVEPVAEVVEEDGQERQRAEDGDERDREADAEPAHERQRHEEQRKTDRDRSAAEDDRSSRGRHRLNECLLTGGLDAVLLPVAVDHEQRVVDRDAEADQHHHVLRVRRELHVLREDPDDPERDRNRDRGEEQRQQKRERSEDEDQQEERDRDCDVELADLEVA
jgi:hypothetical protein